MRDGMRCSPFERRMGRRRLRLGQHHGRQRAQRALEFDCTCQLSAKAGRSPRTFDFFESSSHSFPDTSITTPSRPSQNGDNHGRVFVDQANIILV